MTKTLVQFFMKIKCFFSIFILILILTSCGQMEEINTETDGFLRIDGAEFYYNLTGVGDTLVILHGGPGLSHQYLKPQMDSLLAPHFTLLYYDQRGSGWTSGEKDSLKLNMETYVNDLKQIKEHFGLSKMNLVGHSFGGFFGMYYGISHPEDLNTLVLIDSDAASYKLRTPYQIKMINSRLTDQHNAYLDSLETTEDFKNYDPKTYENYYKVFLTSYFANPRDTSKLYLGFDEKSVPKISSTNGTVRASLGNYDIHDRLNKIQCKTLIMQGTESVFSVEGAQAISAGIPNSELHLFEDCGHFEYIEAPKKFKNLMLNFYEKNEDH